MKRIFSLLFLHSITFGMEQEEQQPIPAAPAEPKANLALMRAITESNHAAVLTALRKNQDQNYLWRQTDEAQHKEYVDLTAGMYALKILRKNNRWECASNVATALTWDLGNAVMKYALNNHAAQYPVLQYVDPIRQSHTAALLFGDQSQEIPVVNTYKPAKRIARDLLVKQNTDLTIERVARWNGNPVTVETCLNSMLHSWNPVTRKDGQDLSRELGQILRSREGIDADDDGLATSGFQGLAMMGFGPNNNRQRRGILVLPHQTLNDQ
jgi:hypothetical protein